MAVATTSIWEIRATGNANNGGLFVPGGAGTTDYSQQDAAQLTITDLVGAGTTTLTSATAGFTTAMKNNGINIGAFGVTDGVASGTTTITSASAKFTQAMVGGGLLINGVLYSVISVASSTSLTVHTTVTAATGRSLTFEGKVFQITAVNSTSSITIDTSVETFTGLTASVGGALNSFEGTIRKMIASGSNGNMVYIKQPSGNTPYTISTWAPWTNNGNNPVVCLPAYTTVEGYVLARGDGTLGCVTLKAASTTATWVVFITSVDSQARFYFITGDSNKISNAAYCLYAVGALHRCVMKNFGSVGVANSVFRSFQCVADNTGYSGYGTGFNNGYNVQCIALSCASGFTGYFQTECVADRCTYGFNLQGGQTHAAFCTAYKCVNGFYTNSEKNTIDRCISSFCTTNGYYIDSGGGTIIDCFSTRDVTSMYKVGILSKYSDQSPTLLPVSPLMDPENRNYSYNPAIGSAARSVTRNFSVIPTQSYRGAGAGGVTPNNIQTSSFTF